MQIDHDAAQTLATLTAIALTLLLAAGRGGAEPAAGAAPEASGATERLPDAEGRAAAPATTAGTGASGAEAPDPRAAHDPAARSGIAESRNTDTPEAAVAAPAAAADATTAARERTADTADVPALLGPEFWVVLGPDTEADREIYEDVRAELFWSPFVDADAVTVAVNGGVVTLTGTVESARERRAAAANAREAGARTVRNDLTIERNPSR